MGCSECGKDFIDGKMLFAPDDINDEKPLCTMCAIMKSDITVSQILAVAKHNF